MGKTFRRNRSDWDDYDNDDFNAKKNQKLENRRQNKKRKLNVRFSDMYDNTGEEEPEYE